MGQAPQGGLPAQAGSAKTLWAVVVLVVVVGGGWYGYKQGWFGGGIEQAPAFSQEQLVGGAPLSETQEGAIATHKQKILERIAQGTPLTKEEKESLGRTMLMEAHLYGFTDAETEVIFRALQQ
jgi:hypothetical protein